VFDLKVDSIGARTVADGEMSEVAIKRVPPASTHNLVSRAGMRPATWFLDVFASMMRFDIPKILYQEM